MAVAHVVPEDEDLFHFIGFNDFDHGDGEGPRIRSSLFKTSGGELSVNLGSIWPLARHREICPAGYGLCSFTLGDLRREVINPANPIDVLPDPLDLDPLLRIPNPAHANLSRELKSNEPRRLAAVAMRWIHRTPPRRD